MSALFNVQKGVPLPEINRTPKGVNRKHPIDTMEVGDMYFVPGRVGKTLSAYVSRIAKELPGRKFSARNCWMRPGEPFEKAQWMLCSPDTAGAKEGTGVWRIE